MPLISTPRSLGYEPSDTQFNDKSQNRSAQDLTADYLFCLYKYINSDLEQRFGSSRLKLTSKYVCITVPSFLSDAAKDLLLRCMQRAGITSNISLATENVNYFPFPSNLEEAADSIPGSYYDSKPPDHC